VALLMDVAMAFLLERASFSFTASPFVTSSSRMRAILTQHSTQNLRVAKQRAIVVMQQEGGGRREMLWLCGVYGISLVGGAAVVFAQTPPGRHTLTQTHTNTTLQGSSTVLVASLPPPAPGVKRVRRCELLPL
jgi:hypothetical protein